MKRQLWDLLQYWFYHTGAYHQLIKTRSCRPTYIWLILLSGTLFLCTRILKEHGNETDFLGFLQKLVPHRSLTLPFEPFRFWLWIRRDIRNWKTTTRLTESESQRLTDSPSWRVGFWMFKRKLGESGSRWLPDSPSQEVAIVSQGVAIQIFKIYHHLKRLNQPFKWSIWQKRSQGCNVLSPLIYLKVWKKLYL